MEHISFSGCSPTAAELTVTMAGVSHSLQVETSRALDSGWELESHWQPYTQHEEDPSDLKHRSEA
jgi:hypothetical protein